MKLDEIQNEWLKDSDIDRADLGEESLKISQLHSKYFKIFSHERLLLKKLEKEYKELFKVKFEYYNGTISQEELRERGWEPNALKILKSDCHIYLDSDKDLSEFDLKIDYQKEKIDFVENIIKSLNSRGFQIKAAIDWIKFQNGIG